MSGKLLVLFSQKEKEPAWSTWTQQLTRLFPLPPRSKQIISIPASNSLTVIGNLTDIVLSRHPSTRSGAFSFTGGDFRV